MKGGGGVYLPTFVPGVLQCAWQAHVQEQTPEDERTKSRLGKGLHIHW